ncbi:MAG: hypothetical protein P4L79_02010 [Legionella sp.]|uniref:hypothetical protein n=1 Tax=Legionella sp. TaxID=459 RepID=UPI002844C8B2|nr:hypothetical protein [Legionella sp.]
MTQFFELSDDVLLALYKKLSPHELLTSTCIGEKPQKLRRLALDALFMQHSKDARVCQQKMLEYWMHHPNPLLVPSKEIMLPALKHQDVLHQLMGLSTLNCTVNATKQIFEPYITHLITQVSSPIITRYDAEHLLHIVPMLGSNHIERIISQQKQNVGNIINGVMRSITRETLNKSGQLNERLNWIQENLQHSQAQMRIAALTALNSLASKLTLEEFAPLIPGLQENLRHQDDRVPYFALQTLNSLASKLNPEQANSLLPELQNKLTHAQENMRIMALQAIKIVTNQLYLENIPLLITKTQENLEHAQGDMCIVALDTLKTLVNRDNPEQISPLIDKTLENLKQPQENMRISYLNTVSALASWFTSGQIDSFLPSLLENLKHPSSQVREIAVQTLKVLAHKLSPDQVTQISAFIQKNLRHSNDIMHLTTLKALKALAGILNSEQLSLFLPHIQENINLNNNMASTVALSILEEQAYKLTHKQLAPLIPGLQENIGHKYDRVRLAVAKALKSLSRQPQNESLAQEIMTWAMNSLHESKTAPEIKKWWQLLLTLDEDVPSMLGYLQPKDNEYLGVEAINWMRNKKTLGNISLTPTFLVNLLVQLNDSEKELRAKDLLSISCNNTIEEEIRDTALQALGSWSIILLQEPQKNKELLNTLVHNLDEEVQKINNPVDKYSIVLHMMKIQIPHAPILVLNETAAPK